MRVQLLHSAPFELFISLSENVCPGMWASAVESPIQNNKLTIQHPLSHENECFIHS